MRIYKYIHSCLLVEEGDEKILFDPGVFSFIEGKVHPETFKDVTTVILTHQHPDHVDKEHIEVKVLEEGDYQTKNVTIRAIPAAHAEILSPTLPQNTAYVLNDTFLNPGDSFASHLSSLKGIKALAAPSMAPWTTELAIVQFVGTMAPQMIIPVHDGYAKDFFLKLRYDNYEKYFSAKGITFQPMKNPGDVVDVK